MFNFFKRKKHGWSVYHGELGGVLTTARLNYDFSNPGKYNFHVGIAFPLGALGYQSFPPEQDNEELNLLEDKFCEYFEAHGGICVATILNRTFKEIDFFLPDITGIKEDYESGLLNFSEKFPFQMMIESDTKGEFFKTIQRMLGI